MPTLGTISNAEAQIRRAPWKATAIGGLYRAIFKESIYRLEKNPERVFLQAR